LRSDPTNINVDEICEVLERRKEFIDRQLGYLFTGLLMVLLGLLIYRAGKIIFMIILFLLFCYFIGFVIEYFCKKIKYK
jgi:predicted lipid-binding transport protein (Tim44 family)